jgi:hypothetical protein
MKPPQRNSIRPAIPCLWQLNGIEPADLKGLPMARKFAKRNPDTFYYEVVEERVLYSADGAPGMDLHAYDGQPLVDGAACNAASTELAAPSAPAIQTPTTSLRELVIVNPNIDGYEQLIADLQGNDANRDIEVAVLDPDRDGISQVTDLLAHRSDLSAIHFITHGADGQINLGNGWLDNFSLQQNANQISDWGKSLTESGDILFYGCNVAARSDGRALVDSLARLTGADVAASDDLTGYAGMGGDWTLEYRSGGIETPEALLQSGQTRWTGTLATYTVTNTNDSGAGSLRQAIVDANANAGADTIAFNLDLATDDSINLLSTLDAITEQVTIDGWSQPGYGGSPLIIIDGDQKAFDGLELYATADGCTIRGFVLRDFRDNAIQIDAGSDNNTVAGNYIGSFGTAGSDLGATEANGGAGIIVEGSNNTIGGTSDAERNVIGGNDFLGIGIGYTSPGLAGNRILGNYIGLSADGATAVGNADEGIYAQQGTGLIIGGATANERNVIAASGKAGIYLWGESNAVIQGNYIGTDAGGTLALGNNTSSNAARGGIRIENVSGTLIGGMITGQGNLIANNTGTGIIVADSASSNNCLLGNAITGNTGLGIDLGDDGVTANDIGDGDTGVNDLQNFPVIGTVVSNATDTHISGTLNATAGTSFRIEFFSSPSADASGYGEGQTYLGYASVTTDGAGNASFDVTLSGIAVTIGHAVSATATVDLGGGSFGSTSEFGAAVANVNDAPTGADTTVTVDEDSAYIFTTGDFGFSDIDGNNLSRVWITTLPDQGELKWNGSPFAAGNWVVAADIDAGLLTYTPVTNASGTGYTSFTFQVEDDGGTADGGVDKDPSPNTITIDVMPVNDAPVGSPTISGTAAEDQTLTADTSAISDADGLGSFSYQWLRDGIVITGATSSSYTLSDADVGTQIRVQVSYTDGQGAHEALVSAPSTAVAPIIGGSDDQGDSGGADNGLLDEDTGIESPYTGEIVDIEPGITTNGTGPDYPEPEIISEPRVEQDPGQHNDHAITTPTSPESDDPQQFVSSTHEEDAGTEQKGLDDSREYVHLEDDLHRKLYYSRHVNFKTAWHAPAPEHSMDYGRIDSAGQDSKRPDLPGDYDLFRQQLDDTFRSQTKGQAFKTQLLTFTCTSLTAGVVSYLLKTSSLVASLLSSLPAWRRFDPIAVFAGKKKKRKEAEVSPDADESRSETFFDDGKK